MGLMVKPKVSRKGEIEDIPSNYNPTGRVKERFKDLVDMYNIGEQIRNQPYEEFNDRTVIDYQSDCQKKFNSYVPPRSEDPDESWKAQTIRPYTRSKVISIAAHVTANIMYPQITAQNEQDEEDKAAADVMRDLMEWTNEQSNYDQAFLYGIISSLVNPACIMHLGYAEVFKEIKEIIEAGKWKEKEVLDEIFSGFFNYVVPIDELYIADIYEHDIQKQPFLIWRKVIDYSLAKQKYSDNENFKTYVRPGIRTFYSDEHDTFYDQYDDNLGGHRVEEVIIYNRFADLEITIVNGVMLDDPDQPIRRKDKLYPFIKGGYELIDEGRFFYYKSLVDKLAPDQEVIDTLYNMIIDGSFLRLMPPLAIFGDEEVDSAVIIPGSAQTFSGETRIEPIGLGNDLNAGLSAIQMVEGSADQNSQDPLQSGQSTTGSQTAFEISRLEQNARTVLGLFGKMVMFMVRDFAKLRVNDILQYLTVAEAMELTSPLGRMKFRNFIIPDKQIDGKTKTKKIQFTDDIADLDEEGQMEMSFALLQQEGGLDSSKKIALVNPGAFRRMKYLVKTQPDFNPAQSESVKRALNLELFDRAIQLPFVDQKAVAKDLLLNSYDATRDDPDKYITKEMQATAQAGQQSQSKMLGQLTGTPEMNVTQVV